MCNFEVDSSILTPHLPPGTELDTFEGKHLVSIVGFIFEKTKILGFPAFFHHHFEELNLRFYVTRKDEGKIKRGTVFISEIVPKFMIPLVANNLYNEHYTALKMRHFIDFSSPTPRVRYEWKSNSGWNRLEVSSKDQFAIPEPGTIENFISQHYWGYNKLNESESIEYGVEHIPWETSPVNSCIFEVYTKELYGQAFEKYLSAAPHSVFLAKGSDVLIRTPVKIRFSNSSSN